MRTILNMIQIFVFGTIVMLFLTYFCVSVYAFFWWDWDAVMQLHLWLNPATNLWVRIGAGIGALLSFMGGFLTSELGY